MRSGWTGGLRAPTVARLLDDPRHAPELLACSAVATLGPYARSWADLMRTVYPTADADGLARLAVQRCRRLAAVGGATSALAGLLAPLAELATVACTQAGLVLHLAAAYGRNPEHPDRAVELLVLTGVHADSASARTALATAGVGPAEADPVPHPEADPAGEATAGPAGEEAPVARDRAWVAEDDPTGKQHRPAGTNPRLNPVLAAQARAWLVVRLAARLVPGAAVLAAAAGDAAAVDRLAARALALYRRPPVTGR
ncbi:hypothetical protein [Micromonospora echinofusca]|uniref:Uncharacterized protein n=1 Tax=Micromonospora echinofusca TaxID=47858 RepID=A0ABS3VTR2_MICEH|nr:hypothetical protein [Micromonospora echinofusca]MBO4207929.1 hypothetical protein [Micromonospora echinofusca]